MSSQSIYYYEEQFKEYIMNGLVGEQVIALKRLLGDVIRENPEDYSTIQFAYMKVKRELMGFNHVGDNEEEVCEQFNHI